MGKTLKYVSDFDFSPAGKTVGLIASGRMLKDTSSNGIKNNKNPGIKNPSKPVAPKQPVMAAYKRGGSVKGKSCYDDGGSVMTAATPTTTSAPTTTASPMTKAAWKQTMEQWKSTKPERTEGMAKEEWRQLKADWKQSRPTKPEDLARNRPERAMNPIRGALGALRNRMPAFNSSPMVAPATPAMKKGGAVPKAGAYKVPKVMSEFKAGELHSGSKSGPVVKSRKQAVAIALSEARAAGKKK